MNHSRSRTARIGLACYVVALSMGLATACGLDDPNGVTSNEVVDLALSDSILDADSVSRARVTVALQGETPSGSEVKFRTDVGRFAEAAAATPREVTVKASGRQVEVTYVAPKRFGIATISAEVGGFLQRREIRLVPARPSIIRLSADKLVAKANGSEAIVFNARLLRRETEGMVSLGTRVDFVTRDSLGNEIPRLRGVAVLENDNGLVSYTLTSSAPTLLSVQAVVAGDESTPISSDSLYVRFVAP